MTNPISMHYTLRLLVVTSTVSFAPCLLTGKPAPVQPPPAETAATPFESGAIDISLLAGAYWSFTPDSSERPGLDYAVTTIRGGVMFNEPSGQGWARGSAELLFEGLFGSVIDGPGDSMAGAGLVLRYNFVQPDAKCVPYVQIGVGALWTDVYQDESQTLIGKSVSFNLTAAVGLRYHLSSQWWLNAEVGYRHVSNADTAARNTGLDSLGGSVGVIYTF